VREFRARRFEGNIKGVEPKQSAIDQSDQILSIDRQISDRGAFDRDTASARSAFSASDSLRTVLREQGDGFAVVANEQSLGRTMIGAAQYGHPLAADLIAVADRAIADQPLYEASIMRFQRHSRTMIFYALGKQYRAGIDGLDTCSDQEARPGLYNPIG
jgi:hypothetical protein